MHISLRPDEKIYINGAVIKVDRKVGLELLNDATFLLQSHVMVAKDATTPLRQLYFIVQMMLMDPSNAGAARDLFQRSMAVMLESYRSAALLGGMRQVESLVAGERIFEALKMIRALLPLEPAMSGEATAATAQAS